MVACPVSHKSYFCYKKHNTKYVYLQIFMLSYNYYSKIFSKKIHSIFLSNIRISLQRQKSPRELMWEKDVTESHLKLFKPNKDNDSIALYKYLDVNFLFNLILFFCNELFTLSNFIYLYLVLILF